MKKILVLLSICLLPLSAGAVDPAPVPAAPKPEAAAPAVSAQPATKVSAPEKQPATKPSEPSPKDELKKPAASASLSLLKPEQTAPKIIQVKIGAVDIGRVSQESNVGKSAQANIKQLQGKLQKQIEGKKKQVEKFKADLEKQMPALPPQQREARAKEFQKKVEEFQKFVMGAEKQLITAQENFTKDLLGAVEKASIEFAEAQKLTAVVVKRELIYVANGVEALDISDQVIKIINAKEPKGGVKK